VGREYALAVAADATGPSRPNSVTDGPEMAARKRSLTAWGRLPVYEGRAPYMADRPELIQDP
jgi:hypothetical protein